MDKNNWIIDNWSHHPCKSLSMKVILDMSIKADKMPVDDTCKNIKMITLNMLSNAIKEYNSNMSNYPDLQILYC